MGGGSGTGGGGVVGKFGCSLPFKHVKQKGILLSSERPIPICKEEACPHLSENVPKYQRMQLGNRQHMLRVDTTGLQGTASAERLHFKGLPWKHLRSKEACFRAHPQLQLYCSKWCLTQRKRSMPDHTSPKSVISHTEQQRTMSKFLPISARVTNSTKTPLLSFEQKSVFQPQSTH